MTMTEWQNVKSECDCEWYNMVKSMTMTEWQNVKSECDYEW